MYFRMYYKVFNVSGDVVTSVSHSECEDDVFYNVIEARRLANIAAPVMGGEMLITKVTETQVYHPVTRNMWIHKTYEGVSL